MKAIYIKLTASASALTMLAASMSAGGIIASARGGSDSGTDSTTVSDYTISIPSTLDVTQAGWNELTGGISAKGSLGQHEKLVVSATSANDWALVSDGNRIGYNLAKSAADYDPNAETPTWEFEELNADGVSQSAGVNVENFDDKPAGEYTDTVTFKAKLENLPVPLQSISLNKSSMVLFTEDFNSENTTEKLSVNFNPEDTTDDKTVTWSSSNPAVATVDQDGNVTAVATGDAVITAKVGDKTVSCNVAVNKVTITNSEAAKKSNDTNPLPEFIKDGIVKVSFDSKGDLCGNYLNYDGWFFYGDNATVTVTSEVEYLKIAKVKFYTKNGSAEVTNAPFTVYSYGYYMYTGPNETGTCFNDWGVNKIEVYLEPGGTGDNEPATPPKYADQLSSGYYVSQEIIDTYWWPSNILDRAGMTNSAFGVWKGQTISEDEAIALAKYLGKDSMVFYLQDEELGEFEMPESYWGVAKNDGNSVESVKLYNTNLHDDPTPMKGYTIYCVVPK